MCSGQEPSVTNSVAGLFPNLVAQWHPTRNGTLAPDDVAARSGRPVWWKCPVGADHEWQAPPHHRSRGVGCPMCAGKQSSITNSLARMYPHVAAEWHPTRNGATTPDAVVAGSNFRAWWQCQLDVNASGRQGWPIGRPTALGCPRCFVRHTSAVEVAVTYEIAMMLNSVPKPTPGPAKWSGHRMRPCHRVA